MHSGGGKQFRHIPELPGWIPSLGQSEANPQIQIHGVAQPRIKISHVFYEQSSKEAGRLANKTMKCQVLPAEFSGWILVDGFSSNIHVIGITVKHHQVWIVLKLVSYMCQGSRVIQIISVEPAKDLSVASLKAFVDGLSLTLVKLRNPLQLGSVAF